MANCKNSLRHPASISPQMPPYTLPTLERIFFCCFAAFSHFAIVQFQFHGEEPRTRQFERFCCAFRKFVKFLYLLALVARSIKCRILFVKFLADTTKKIFQIQRKFVFKFKNKNYKIVHLVQEPTYGSCACHRPLPT